MDENRKCPRCDKLFSISNKTKLKKFCSSSCAKAYWSYGRRRRPNSQNLLDDISETRKCLRCSKIFSALNKARFKKFCSHSCRRSNWRTNTVTGRASVKRENNSEKGLARIKRYEATEKGKKTRAGINERHRNSQKYRQTVLAYINSEHGKETRKNYQESEVGRAALRKSRKIYDNRYPERIKANRQVCAAVRSGEIIKSIICSKCKQSSDNIQGHHHKGYELEFYLAVIWLCPVCHHEEHEITCNCTRGRNLRSQLV